MTDHQRLRELSAAYVLGALQPDERRPFESHLADCEECRREVASFAPIPSLLSHVDGLESERLPAALAETAAARARSDWAAMARSRRIWRAAAAVAALAIAVLVTATVLPEPDTGEPTLLLLQPSPVAGQVAIEARPWGTAVHIDLEGLPQRDGYVAWVVDDLGNRQQAATWGPTPAGVAILKGASAIPADQIAFVAVTDGSGSEILVEASTG